MREAIVYALLAVIAVCAFIGARSAYQASQIKPIQVQELIVVVDSGDDAEAILTILQDIMTVD